MMTEKYVYADILAVHTYVAIIHDVATIRDVAIIHDVATIRDVAS